MTKKIALKARIRKEDEKNTKNLRKQGLIPGIVYGKGIDNLQVVLNHGEIERAFKEAGESTLVQLHIDEKPVQKVLIKDVEFDQKHQILHVDLFKVDMKNPIEVELPFVFVNESKAEKEQGAMILRNAESVNVRCLPGDLIDNIEIDLSKLENMGDMIRMSDLNLSDDFEMLSAPDEVIAIASEPKVEEEPVEEAAPAEGEEKTEEQAESETENK